MVPYVDVVVAVTVMCIRDLPYNQVYLDFRR